LRFTGLLLLLLCRWGKRRLLLLLLLLLLRGGAAVCDCGPKLEPSTCHIWRDEILKGFQPIPHNSTAGAAATDAFLRKQPPLLAGDPGR
jgi:hypothetical protein